MTYAHRITRCMQFATLIQMLANACTSHTPIPLSAIGMLKEVG